MTRPTIIAGNWKMHKTIREATRFIEVLRLKMAKSTSKVLIAPPFTAITGCVEAAKGSGILIGAQNMSDSDEGAFTGEISARMLKDAGATFVILGHSERRSHFGETNEHIHHKLKRAVKEEIPAIVCIGESEKERESGRSHAVLEKQIDGCLGLLSSEELENLILAYEPVWAIGTGKTATPQIAQDTHKAIRTYLTKRWDDDFANSVSILYGGSVKPENITSLINQPDIDGALIGGASLDVEAFTQMVLQ